MDKPIRVIEGNAKPFEPFWTFRNAANTESGEAELEFNGPISEYSWGDDVITPKKFKEDLYKFGLGGPVTVMMNSGGGDIFAASVIRTYLQEYPGKVTVDIIGLAASAATIVMTGASHIRIRESAWMMIHDPATIAWGNIEEIKKTLDVMKTLKDGIVDSYATKTKLEKDKLSRMMTDETWMTAREAVNLGFADEVVTGSLKRAMPDMAARAGFVNCLMTYAHVPDALLGQLNLKPGGERTESDADPAPEPAAAVDREAEKLRKFIEIYC